MSLNEILQPVTLPAWIVSLPLLAAVFSFVLPRIRVWAGIFTAIITPLMVVFLGREIFIHGAIQMQVGGWQSPLGIALYADGLSASMLGLTAIVIGSITFYARSYLSGDAASRYFWSSSTGTTPGRAGRRPWWRDVAALPLFPLFPSSW